LQIKRSVHFTTPLNAIYPTQTMRTFFSRNTLFLLLLLTTANTLLAQDPNLANQYFSDQEFEKAASLYSQLSDKEPRNDYFFNRYIECLLGLQQYDEAEKAIKKQLKRTPENIGVYITYGTVFSRQNKTAEMNEQFEKAISKMAPDYASVQSLANQFVRISEFDFAIKAYERGGQLLKDENRFAFNLAELYRRKGESPKMIYYYLNSLKVDPGRLTTVQTFLQRFLAESEYAELQTQLYERIQQDENAEYVELLAWSFVQRKDFKSALRQYRALDKRLGENGQRVFSLANDAADAHDFETAIQGFDYIIIDKGALNPFFFDAKRRSMECRRQKITEGYSYSQAELLELEKDYEGFLAEHGKNRQTAYILLQLGDLEAYYINNIDKAISLLEEMKNTPGLDRFTLASVKVNLADYYLISGDRWESTLLYSQVDKDFRDEQQGQEARFKNARLSYFVGDFQWAQAQFDILKGSTDKLIANDALDLSVFIMDNLNLDTSAAAISLYSGAELLVYQNRFEDAFLKLDTLRRDFPEHSLQDDILYLEAQIHQKRRNYKLAAELYSKVAENYKEDIRADNALYNLAQLYENQLSEPEKAKEIYEKIFVDYSGSVFAVDARKRYRILRGDKIQ
jgi:tetratricopeptide (TPR) repeat protein